MQTSCCYGTIPGNDVREVIRLLLVPGGGGGGGGPARGARGVLVVVFVVGVLVLG
jgi:hypothetical protein